MNAIILPTFSSVNFMDNVYLWRSSSTGFNTASLACTTKRNEGGFLYSSNTVADADCPDGAAMALVVKAPKLRASVRPTVVIKDLI